MVITSYGVLSDHLNRVFLQKEPRHEFLAPPGRILEPGRLPPDTLAAAFREESGLIVLPLRLTGLYFRRGEPDSLFFCFRCLMRGGELAIPDGRPEAGFFDSRPLPRSMLAVQQQQVSRALYHSGGRPRWEQQAQSWGRRLRSWLGEKNSEPSAALWQVNATAVTRNENGQVLWARRPGEHRWQLPTAERRPNEAPWATARRALHDTLGAGLPLTNLPAVYIGKQEWNMTFVFTAECGTAKFTALMETAYFDPGAEPDNSEPQHVAQVIEVHNPGEETRFMFSG